MRDDQADEIIRALWALESAVRGLGANWHPGTMEPVSLHLTPMAPASAPFSEHTRPLGELIEEYLDEKRASGEWSAGHEETTTHWLGHMTLFFGESKPITAITREDILRYRQHLLETPIANTNQRRAPSTVNKLLVFIGAFFRWARDVAGVIDKDPTAKTKLKASTKSRAPFTLEEIQLVWRGLREEAPTPAHFWIPTICLFTGCRREEAAQLKRSDIRLDASVPYIDFGEAANDGRGLKTEASARKVPIHPELLPVLERWLQGSMSDEVFRRWCPPNPKGIRGGTVGTWFGNRLRRLGIPSSKVLHSLRHSMATRLKGLGAEEYIIAQLLGHENQNITSGRYGHDVDLEPLREWLSRLSFNVEF